MTKESDVCEYVLFVCYVCVFVCVCVCVCVCVRVCVRESEFVCEEGGGRIVSILDLFSVCGMPTADIHTHLVGAVNCYEYH